MLEKSILAAIVAFGSLLAAESTLSALGISILLWTLFYVLETR